MRKLFLILIFTFVQFSFSYAQEAAEIYSKAMEAYNSHRYGDAIPIFEKFFKNYSLYNELYATAKFYESDSYLNMGKKDPAAAGFEYLVNNFIWSDFRYKALYKLGLIYFDKTEYAKSRERLKTLLEDYPESEHSGSALYWIGESYSKQNKLEDAIVFLKDAIEDKRNNKFVDYSIFTLASIFEKVGDYENAVKYYDQLLSYHRDSPLRPAAQIRIGICYFKLKDYESSILELNNPIVSSLPREKYAESLYLLANSYYRVKDYAKAENTYKEIIKTFPNSDLMREIKYGLAWSLFQQKKYNKAYNVFNGLSIGGERDSIALKSFYWKAESKRYAGQDQEAFKIFSDFEKYFPDSKLVENVRYQLGVLYFNNKKYDMATRYLHTATVAKDAETKAKAFTMLGEIELDKKNFQAAESNFRQVMDVEGITPDMTKRALLGLGVALFYQNKYDEGMRILNRLEMVAPGFESDKVNFYLAECLFAKNRYSEALAKYNKVNLNDELVGSSALYGKAYCYFNLRDYNNAALYFSDFIKKYPNDSRAVDARLRLADSYYGSKDFASASRVYQDLLKYGRLSISNPYTNYQYAQALFKAGKDDQAIDEFAALQRKYPNSEYGDKSLYIIGWIYFQQSNFEQAINSYRNVLNVYPNSSLKAMVYYSIGDAFFNLAKYDSAIANYQNVIVETPSSNHVYDAINGIQYSYVAEGHPEKAISLIDDFIKRNPSLSFADQIFFKKGEIYYSLRKYQKAEDAYKEFVADYPQSSSVPDAYYWIGKSAQNLKQYEEAVFNFNKVFENYPSSDAAPAAVIETGNVYDSLKQYDKALAVYDQALDKLSDSKRVPEIQYNKGMTLVEMQDYAKAYDVFDEIAQYYRNSIFAAKSKLELGLIEMKMKHYDKAAEFFKDLADNRTDDLGAEGQYYLGLSYFEQQQYTEAITAFVRVRTIFSSYDEWMTKSYLKLGDSYVELKEYSKAKDMFREVLSKHRGDKYGKEAQTKLRTLK